MTVTVLKEPRSVTPPRRPARRWTKTRPCRCGECRFNPPGRQCPDIANVNQTRPGDWLWITEGRSA